MSVVVLEPGDLETLDRLCEKGEMLCTRRFHQLQTLIRVGYAEVVEEYKALDIELVKPTASGRAIAEYRMAQKLHG